MQKTYFQWGPACYSSHPIIYIDHWSYIMYVMLLKKHDLQYPAMLFCSNDSNQLRDQHWLQCDSTILDSYYRISMYFCKVRKHVCIFSQVLALAIFAAHSEVRTHTVLAFFTLVMKSKSGRGGGGATLAVRFSCSAAATVDFLDSFSSPKFQLQTWLQNFNIQHRLIPIWTYTIWTQPQA